MREGGLSNFSNLKTFEVLWVRRSERGFRYHWVAGEGMIRLGGLTYEITFSSSRRPPPCSVLHRETVWEAKIWKWEPENLNSSPSLVYDLRIITSFLGFHLLWFWDDCSTQLKSQRSHTLTIPSFLTFWPVFIDLSLLGPWFSKVLIPSLCPSPNPGRVQSLSHSLKFWAFSLSPHSCPWWKYGSLHPPPPICLHYRVYKKLPHPLFY